jgi:hypothetical protein
MRSKFSTFFDRYKEFFDIENTSWESTGTSFFFRPKKNIQFKMDGVELSYGHFHSDQPNTKIPESLCFVSVLERDNTRSWTYELDGDVVANWTLVELNPRKIA